MPQEISIIQKHYPSIEIDKSEKDIIIIWQNGKDESNCIMIERNKIEEFINFLNTPTKK